MDAVQMFTRDLTTNKQKSDRRCKRDLVVQFDKEAKFPKEWKIEHKSLRQQDFIKSKVFTRVCDCLHWPHTQEPSNLDGFGTPPWTIGGDHKHRQRKPWPPSPGPRMWQGPGC